MSEQYFLDLTGSEEVQGTALALARATGIKLTMLPMPKQVHEVNALVKQYRPAFVLVQPDTVYLSRPLRIKSTWFPPALAFVNGRPTTTTIENLRVRGVAAIVTPELREAQKQKFSLLVESPDWLQVRLKQMHLSQLLQSVEETGSFMVTVATREVDSVSVFDWTTESETSWYGRIYVEDSMIVHTETSTATGSEALAEMLELKDGTATVQTVSLGAADGDLRSSIQGALIRSAVAKDDRDQTPIPQPKAQKKTAPRPWPTVSRRSPPTTNPARLGGGVQGVPLPSHSSLSGPSVSVLPQAPKAQNGSLAGAAGTNGAKMQQSTVSALSPDTPVDVNLDKLVDGEGALNSAAACSQDGWLEGISGKIDGESQSAAAAMGSRSASSAGELLGLGSLRGFVLSNPEQAAYVACENSRLVVGRGKRSARPFDVLEKMRSVLQNTPANANLG